MVGSGSDKVSSFVPKAEKQLHVTGHSGIASIN